MKYLSIILLIPFHLCMALPEELKSLKLMPKFPPTIHEIAEGPKYFVSPQGSDKDSGSQEKPFRTIQFALTQMRPGDSLYLRGGVYRENVRVALRGTSVKPITLAGYPEENAIIDGSFAEFYEEPENAWELLDAELHHYQSKKLYPNLRNILGSFGDTMLGLQTYYHQKDLLASSEVFVWEDWDRRQETDLKPVYLGPGMWYNHDTGRIHLRLAHTDLPDPISNYRGKQDPRKLPLLLAPYQSTPLSLNGAEHIHIRDLVIRGAGYTAVQLEQARHIEFNHVTIWAGAYGIRASGTQYLRLLNCGVYGNVAPWTFRADGSKRDYPGRPHRNLSRLNTHASIEIDSGRESSVHAFPQNDHWEIAYCEFTDAHDGPYLGAINVHFHHNLVENMHDDGLYLSPMYKRHWLENKDPVIRIEQNLFRQVLTPLAFGGPWPETRDQIYIYRNVFDLRVPVPTGRPTTKRPTAAFSTGKLMGDHGSPPWPAMNIYHNTVITGDNQRRAPGGAFGGLRSGNPRRVFNNLFLHLGRLPTLTIPKPEDDFSSDGNLYWSWTYPVPSPEKFFGKFHRAHPNFEKHAILADPKLRDLSIGFDYRLLKGSAAIDAGVPIPEDWPDSKLVDDDKPDIGAIPKDADLYRFGRRPRGYFYR